MKNTVSKELIFMNQIENWLVRNDIKDEPTSLGSLAEESLTSYLSEVKWVLSWKAPDLTQEFNEMINDFKSNKDKEPKIEEDLDEREI